MPGTDSHSPDDTPGGGDPFDALFSDVARDAGPQADRDARTRAEQQTRASRRAAADAGVERSRRRRELREDARKPRRRGRKALLVTVVTVVIVGLLAASGLYVWKTFEPQISALLGTGQVEDYEGSGSGEVVVVIQDGDIGSDVATTLVDAGVTASYDAFYDLLLEQDPEPVFAPGAYTLAARMSAQAALDALQDDDNRMVNSVVIPEGTTLSGILSIIEASTDISADDLQQAADDYASYGIPDEATSLEGFLFPATYQVTPGTSAHDLLQTLVDRMFEALDDAGVAKSDRWETVVFASLVQKEARLADDFPKVARVFQNRLDEGWKLQSDATVAYGTGNTDRVETTNAEREDASNPYNTYQHDGLPVGPISNPGDVAIDAALHPADGTWMYFCTWNLETGETIFSTTSAEHDAAVAKWQAWMDEHPEYS